MDHLRLVPYDEPDRQSGATRRYLLIYDSVPGGTGYLHELLRDADRLFEVMRLARDHMTACTCNQDPAADGCYRCLYAYRLGSGMDSTSRRVAVDMLTEILEARDKLEPVETLSEILINPSFESALEARFIEAFRRRSGTDSGVRIQQDVVRGKTGYRLRLDDLAYTVETHVCLGPEDGVSVCSKPDFLIRPERSTQSCLPVAVFTDGFEYHKQSITEDTLKRLALSQSGRFWTWSLTWQDLENALSGTDGTLRPLPPSGTGPFDAGSVKIATALGSDGLLPALVQSPFDQLLAWLRRPDEAAWAGAVFARALSWAKPDVDTPAVAATRDWLHQRAPSPMRERLDDLGPSLCGEVRLGEEGSTPDCKWIVPASALKAPLMPSALIALLTLDVATSKDEKALREAWRRMLAGANLLQFLPCAVALTAEGSTSGVYEQAGWARQHPASGPTPGTGSPLWQAAMDDAVGEAGPGLAHLMAQGSPLPAVGFELQAATGAILAEAELAWEQARVAVLRPDQEDQAPAWQGAGWTVVRLDEDWAEQALAQLRG